MGGKRTHQRSYRSRIVQEELRFRSEVNIEAIKLLLLTREKKRSSQFTATQGVRSVDPARSAPDLSALNRYRYITAGQACG